MVLFSRFLGSARFFLSHADFADIKMYIYPSLSVKISMYSCTFSKNLSILCLMLFLKSHS